MSVSTNMRNYEFVKALDNDNDNHKSVDKSVLLEVFNKKVENRPFVVNNIKETIRKKHNIFINPETGKSICFVGHSQLEQWNIDTLCGYKVRNCAISGITSFEYEDLILKKELLNCNSDVFLVMHGTNDIVWDYSISEIVDSIIGNIEYIRKRNESAPIIYMSCMHVNQRVDRSNDRINELNNALQSALEYRVIWIDTSFMDDENGRMSKRYTTDGLHINKEGYGLMKEEIEKTMKENKL